MVAGSGGSACVSDDNSLWTTGEIVVGKQGAGSIMIENEGRLDSSQGVIGQLSGSYGEITVTGLSSRWDLEGT